jgi:hypothetical protein
MIKEFVAPMGACWGTIVGPAGQSAGQALANDLF